MDEIAKGLLANNFLFVEAKRALELLSQIAQARIGDDDLFRASWKSLEQDQYMADGGNYRKRRHATYATYQAGEQPCLMPHQPHYQTVDYNPLNGGVARYFAPIIDELHHSITLSALLEFGNRLFSQVSGLHQWHIELHQFRIEARDGEKGKPTPEGVHRDGVDFVIVVMIRRVYIESGATRIYDLDNNLVGEFTMLEPFDLALVSDRRVYHGVTPITRLVADKEAYRDVLVITFKNRE